MKIISSFVEEAHSADMVETKGAGWRKEYYSDKPLDLDTAGKAPAATH